MLADSTQQPLKCRLIANFLLCAVSSVLSLTIAFGFDREGQTAALTPLLVAAALTVVLAMCVVLRMIIGGSGEIEHQLRGFALHDAALRSVADSGPLSAGWNRVLDLILTRQTLEKLESRLNDAVDGGCLQAEGQIINSLPDGVAVTDPEGRVRIANHALRALLDIDPNESLDGRTMLDLLSSENSGEVAELLGEAAHCSRPVVAEMQHGEGEKSTVLRVARSPLFAGDRESSMNMWTVRDVTQQNLADKMRAEFLQSAAHELRTPLMNIRAYAETLELTEDIDVEQQKEFCNIINSEAIRLSRFVDELLDIDKMEAGGLSLDSHEIDLERLLDDVIGKVQPQMKKKNIEFAQEIPAKLPKLFIDKDKIAAALLNLLGNAAKYTPAGGNVSLSVECDEQECRFHVEDTGFGISQEELPKVFDRFFRSDDSRVQEETGSGLGLAFTHEVVRLHEGRLDVHSELNHGTKFTMVLPVGEGAL